MQVESKSENKKAIKQTDNREHIKQWNMGVQVEITKAQQAKSDRIFTKLIHTAFTTLIHTQKQKLIHKFHAYPHRNKHHSFQDEIKTLHKYPCLKLRYR